MNPTDFIQIYLTCKDLEEAQTISKVLVEEKLVACANIGSKISSIYHWQNQIIEDDEIYVLFKTRKSLFSKMEIRIKQLHSYTVPCIIATEIVLANESYLNWIFEVTEQ